MNRIYGRKGVSSDVINNLHREIATETENLYFPKVAKTALIKSISTLVNQRGFNRMCDEEHQIFVDSEDEAEEIFEVQSMRYRLDRAIENNINFNIRSYQAQYPNDLTTCIRKK